MYSEDILSGAGFSSSEQGLENKPQEGMIEGLWVSIPAVISGLEQNSDSVNLDSTERKVLKLVGRVLEAQKVPPKSGSTTLVELHDDNGAADQMLVPVPVPVSGSDTKDRFGADQNFVPQEATVTLSALAHPKNKDGLVELHITTPLTTNYGEILGVKNPQMSVSIYGFFGSELPRVTSQPETRVTLPAVFIQYRITEPAGDIEGGMHLVMAHESMSAQDVAAALEPDNATSDTSSIYGVVDGILPAEFSINSGEVNGKEDFRISPLGKQEVKGKGVYRIFLVDRLEQVQNE